MLSPACQNVRGESVDILKLRYERLKNVAELGGKIQKLLAGSFHATFLLSRQLVLQLATKMRNYLITINLIQVVPE